MSIKNPCVICSTTQAKTLTNKGDDGEHQECPRCGEFKISGSALAMIMGRGETEEKIRAKISGWSRDQNRAGTTPEINSGIFENIVSRPIPSLIDRATRLLIEAGHKHELATSFNIGEPRFLAATYSSNEEDLYLLMRILYQRGFIENQTDDGNAYISPDGYIELDNIFRHPSNSLQGFIAMWFDTCLGDAYINGFHKGVMDAGYNPVRIDRVEHINRIDDEIIVQINASKFVVADFTGHRGGVYFEAGYALGMDLPVFWTCRKDHLNNLHFDIRQFNCIDWESPQELAERLSKRIEAVLGKGVQ
jgi:hypothetical protein